MIKFDIVKELIEVLDKEEVLKGIKRILNDNQMQVLSKLKRGEFTVDDRIIAYRSGINMSEIGEHTGCTRAAISKYLNPRIEKNKEEVEEEFKENREKLHRARRWYLYVYLSDKEGDYRQVKKHLSSTLREDGTAYNYYVEYGGKKLQKDHVDGRTKIKTEKEERILKRLEDEPIEKVAFQERITTGSIETLAEENDVVPFTEKEIGENTYTIKYVRWQKKKEAIRKRELEERRKEREEKEKNRG